MTQMSVFATGWGKCQAGELWGRVSAPLLCTQGVALGWGPRTSSLLHVRPQETGHGLVPAPEAPLCTSPQCCWPHCWLVLSRPLGPQLMELVPTACVQRWGHEVVPAKPSPSHPSSHGCCGLTRSCPCSQPCQAPCPCSAGQPGWPGLGEGGGRSLQPDWVVLVM